MNNEPLQPGSPRPRRDSRETEDEALLESPPPQQAIALHKASDSWRALRILGEFVWGFDNLADVSGGVSIFGSARTRPEDPHYEAAVETARLLAEAGIPVITGGGPGIMEAANKGAFEANGLSIGCNIELPFEQGTNAYVTRSLMFKFFFVRKMMFVKYAAAFIVFPGGYGTLDELFEALTLVQTGKTRQMPIILVHEPFWRGLLEWMRERLAAEGMIDLLELDLLQVCNQPQEVVDAIFAFYEKRGFEPSPQEREVLLNL